MRMLEKNIVAFYAFPDSVKSVEHGQDKLSKSKASIKHVCVCGGVYIKVILCFSLTRTIEKIQKAISN